MKALLTGAALALALSAGAYAQSAMPTQTPVQSTPVPSTMPAQQPVQSTMPTANQTPEAPANGTMPNANGAVSSGGRVAPNGTMNGNAPATTPIPPNPQCTPGATTPSTCLPPNTNCLPGQTSLPGSNCPVQ
jgi:hypothetical protein